MSMARLNWSDSSGIVLRFWPEQAVIAITSVFAWTSSICSGAENRCISGGPFRASCDQPK
jgi:hypothetical protein